MSKKYTLPSNCSIERVGTNKRDRAFRLIFQADKGDDYVSEVYVPEKGETIQKAAYYVCLKFGWDLNPPGSKGRLITNLKEFLDWRGCGDDPYSWARAYYKYTDCGPWVNFLIADGENTKEVYYEDLLRSAPATNDNCVGIQFGSIVEGSEAFSGPFTHLFPFWTKDWQRDEEWMEKETSFYWKRDNASWYCVRSADEYWIVADVWGEIEWQGGEPPEKIKSLAEKAIRDDWQPKEGSKSFISQTIPQIPCAWRPRNQDKEWKALPLGDTGAEIYTFENDATFD